MSILSCYSSTRTRAAPRVRDVVMIKSLPTTFTVDSGVGAASPGRTTVARTDAEAPALLTLTTTCATKRGV